ncbi:MAG: sigma-70 family RNA polymerase sigma factor [Leptospirales bacterium]|nr:sigma-70 family RNA polymerase sigma factor [Leptospirales bacterium]
MNPGQWLEQHGGALYTYARARLSDAAMAEDLVQEALLAAWQSRHSFRGRSSERTWLISILKHKLMDHLRRRYRQAPETNFDPYDGVSPFDEQRFYIHSRAPQHWQDPHTQAELSEFRAALLECLQRLPERARLVFQMRELDGEKTEKICDRLELSATNFHTLMHRARSALRQCVGKRSGYE